MPNTNSKYTGLFVMKLVSSGEVKLRWTKNSVAARAKALRTLHETETLVKTYTLEGGKTQKEAIELLLAKEDLAIKEGETEIVSNEALRKALQGERTGSGGVETETL